MNQEIVNAIAAYLENQIWFGYLLGFSRFHKIAQEIAAKIDPLLPKSVGWEDAPPWAKWRAIDENENIAYSLDFPSANTKMEVPKGFTSTVKVERRPNDQTPSFIR